MKKAKSSTSPTHGDNHNDPSDTKDHDRFLPIANVGRIMKKSLPPNAKISKEAKETVQECVSEFISFITGEASDKCQKEKRKTVNGDDILWAMTTLGFENYVGPLKAYLNKYRESEGDAINTVARQELDHSKYPSSSVDDHDEKDSLHFSSSGDYDRRHVINTTVGKSYEFEYGNGNIRSSAIHGSVEW